MTKIHKERRTFEHRLAYGDHVRVSQFDVVAVEGGWLVSDIRVASFYSDADHSKIGEFVPPDCPSSLADFVEVE